MCPLSNTSLLCHKAACSVLLVGLTSRVLDIWQRGFHVCVGAWPVGALQADPESRAVATLAARIHDQYITPIQVGLWLHLLLPPRHAACGMCCAQYQYHHITSLDNFCACDGFNPTRVTVGVRRVTVGVRSTVAVQSCTLTCTHPCCLLRSCGSMHPVRCATHSLHTMATHLRFSFRCCCLTTVHCLLLSFCLLPQACLYRKEHASRTLCHSQSPCSLGNVIPKCIAFCCNTARRPACTASTKHQSVPPCWPS